MPIDYSKFIFHSNRIPFGASGSQQVTLAIGGAVSFANGKQVWSDIIPLGAYSIAPRLVYTIPPGTWYENVGGAVAAGTRRMATGFRYIAQSGTNYRGVDIYPKIKYESNGIRIGVQMWASYSGTAVTSVTVPATNLTMDVAFDVIPKNIK